MKSEKILLDLENFDEKLALELLIKENDGSNEFNLYFNYNDYLTKDEMEKARKIQNLEGLSSVKDGIYDVLDEFARDNFFYTREDELISDVLRKHFIYSEITDEYEEMQDKLREVIEENFEWNIDVEGLLKNTDVHEVDLYLQEGEKTGNVGFNSIGFLIQSQGYEAEDLYDKEKVENSKFLKSLLNELEELSNGKDGSVVFSTINAYNLKQFIELEESQKNIEIPKDGILVGIYSGDFDEILPLGIELEKDIVVDRKHVEIISEFSEDAEELLIDEKKYMVGDKNRSKFKETEEKGFEMHEFDKEEVFEKLETFKQEKVVDEIEK